MKRGGFDGVYQYLIKDKTYLGKHIVASFYGCAALPDSPNEIEKIMLDAAFESGATPVTTSAHRFEPHGVSVVVIVEESHLAIHTWPEYGYAEIDIYTCGDHTFPEKALEFLRGAFQPTTEEVLVLGRGPVKLVKKFKG